MPKNNNLYTGFNRGTIPMAAKIFIGMNLLGLGYNTVAGPNDDHAASPAQRPAAKEAPATLPGQPAAEPSVKLESGQHAKLLLLEHSVTPPQLEIPSLGLQGNDGTKGVGKGTPGQAGGYGAGGSPELPLTKK